MSFWGCQKCGGIPGITNCCTDTNSQNEKGGTMIKTEWVKSNYLFDTHYLIDSETSQILGTISAYAPYGGVVEYYEITECLQGDLLYVKAIVLSELKKSLERKFK